MKQKLTILFMLFVVFGFSQTPELINYQAVLRDSVGQVLSNQQLDLQLSILRDNTSGLTVFQELHDITTNDFGQITLQIGGGSTTIGNFSSIDWGADEYYIQTAIDSEGFGMFMVLGTSQMVSVPYALNSKRTESLILTDLNGNQYELWIDTLGNIGTYPSYENGEPCPGMPYINYMGQPYYTIEVGNQCWLRENLNVGVMIDGNIDMQDNDTIEKYCYENDTQNCETYGGLYQWNELMQYTNNEKTQGICPNGWHIPSQLEFNILTNYLGGDSTFTGGVGSDTIAGGKLKTIGTIEDGTGLWHTPNLGATNEVGFSIVPSGNRRPGYPFEQQGNRGYFWTSTEYDNDQVWYRRINYSNKAFESNENTKEKGFSVRCLRDQNINQPPNTPINPDPMGGSTGVSISSTLNWTCSDPDNDLLTFDIYLGTTNPPELINSGQHEMSFDPGILGYGTECFWKIVAHDQFNTTEGPVWSFSTEDPPTNGLVAYYPFSGNANDESGNGIHGIPIGVILENDRFGNPNSAYYFDGNDDKIDFGDNFDTFQKMSIAAWIKFDSNCQDTIAYGIITKHGDYGGFSGKSFNIRKASHDNLLTTRHYGSNKLVECKDNVSPNFGEWIFMVSSFDNGQSKLYVNGIQVCANDSTFSIQNTTTSVLVGDNETNDQPFFGNIDDIRIYDRLLNDFEIQGLFKQ